MERDKLNFLHLFGSKKNEIAEEIKGMREVCKDNKAPFFTEKGGRS